MTDAKPKNDAPHAYNPALLWGVIALQSALLVLFAAVLSISPETLAPAFPRLAASLTADGLAAQGTALALDAARTDGTQAALDARGTQTALDANDAATTAAQFAALVAAQTGTAQAVALQATYDSVAFQGTQAAVAQQATAAGVNYSATLAALQQQATVTALALTPAVLTVTPVPPVALDDFAAAAATSPNWRYAAASWRLDDTALVAQVEGAALMTAAAYGDVTFDVWIAPQGSVALLFGDASVELLYEDGRFTSVRVVDARGQVQGAAAVTLSGSSAAVRVTRRGDVLTIYNGDNLTALLAAPAGTNAPTPIGVRAGTGTRLYRLRVTP